MKVQLESTTKIVHVNGVPARVWEGHTIGPDAGAGIRVHAFITRIAVHKDEDQSQFEAELQECRAPTPEVDTAYPARIVL